MRRAAAGAPGEGGRPDGLLRPEPRRDRRGARATVCEQSKQAATGSGVARACQKKDSEEGPGKMAGELLLLLLL